MHRLISETNREVGPRAGRRRANAIGLSQFKGSQLEKGRKLLIEYLYDRLVIMITW